MLSKANRIAVACKYAIPAFLPAVQCTACQAAWEGGVIGRVGTYNCKMQLIGRVQCVALTHILLGVVCHVMHVPSCTSWGYGNDLLPYAAGAGILLLHACNLIKLAKPHRLYCFYVKIQAKQHVLLLQKSETLA